MCQHAGVCHYTVIRGLCSNSSVNCQLQVNYSCPTVSVAMTQQQGLHGGETCVQYRRCCACILIALLLCSKMSPCSGKFTVLQTLRAGSNSRHALAPVQHGANVADRGVLGVAAAGSSSTQTIKVSAFVYRHCTCTSKSLRLLKLYVS